MSEETRLSEECKPGEGELEKLKKELDKRLAFLHMRVDMLEDELEKVKHATGLEIEVETEFSLEPWEDEES